MSSSSDNEPAYVGRPTAASNSGMPRSVGRGVVEPRSGIEPTTPGWHLR